MRLNIQKLQQGKSIYADQVKKNVDLKLKNKVNWENVDWLHKFFSKNLGYNTSLAILASILPESMGDPNKKQFGGGPGRGLLQWEKGTDRYNNMTKYKRDSVIKNVPENLQNQAEYIINTSLNNLHKDDWHHGGKGSGFESGELARKKFISKYTPASVKAKIFSMSYVRPKAGKIEADRRSSLIQSLDSIYNSKYFKVQGK